MHLGGTHSDRSTAQMSPLWEIFLTCQGQTQRGSRAPGAQSPLFPLGLRHPPFNDTFPVSRPQWSASSWRQGHILPLAADPAPMLCARPVAAPRLFQLQLLIITPTSILFAASLPSARFSAEGANRPTDEMHL